MVAAARSAASRAAQSRLARALPWALVTLLVAQYLWGAVARMAHPNAAVVDFSVYFDASRRLAGGHALYGPVPPCCFDVAAMSGYTYPPLLAILLRPLVALSIDDAARVFLLSAHAALVGAVVILHRTLRGRVSPVAFGWLLVALLTYQPIQAGLFGIQVANLILLLESIAAYSVVRSGRGTGAGIALGAGAAIKVSPILLAPALLTLPREAARRGIFALAATLGLALGAMRLASAETGAYFTHVLPSFSGGVIAPWNRSLPGVVLRTVGASGHTPPAMLVEVFTGIAVLVLGATLLAGARLRSVRGRAATLGALAAAVPIVSGVTWDHHLVGEVVAVALLAPLVRRWSAPFWLVLAGILLTDVNQQWIDRSLQLPGSITLYGVDTLVFVIAASVNLAGMVCIWLAALLCIRAERTAGVDQARGEPVVAEAVLELLGRARPALRRERPRLLHG
jgi:hypothetical protein